MVKFLSRRWLETAKITAEGLDPEKDLKNTSASLLNIINNIPPDGKTIYFYISINNGIITEMKLDQNNSLMTPGNHATPSSALSKKFPVYPAVP